MGAQRAVRHVGGRHDERLPAEIAQLAREGRSPRTREGRACERRGRRRARSRSRSTLRLEPLPATGQVLVEARQRLGDELGHLRRGHERAPALEPADEARCARDRRAPAERPSGSRRSARRAPPRSGSCRRPSERRSRSRLEQLAQLVVVRNGRGLVDRTADLAVRARVSTAPVRSFSASCRICNDNMLVLHHCLV